VLGRTHLLGGAAAGLLLAWALHLHGAVAAHAALPAALAGPLPDVDHPGSLYGRLVPLPGMVRTRSGLEPWGRVCRGTPFGVLWHRGPTHSFAAAGAAGILGVAAGLVSGWGPLVGLGALAGCLSHLALDALNVEGQELLWPWSGRRIRPPSPRWPVGSAGEAVVSAGLLALCALLVRGSLLGG
jgi:inner membrane protein